MTDRERILARANSDTCTPSGDAQELQDMRPRSLRFDGNQELAHREGQNNFGHLSAGLLSEGFQQRLKHSLEQFTRQQQEMARGGKEGVKEEWEASKNPQSSKGFQSPVASLAGMGPAARELAQMIHASQQWQHFGDFSSQFQNEEDRPPAQSTWMQQLQNNTNYQDYWRSPGHLVPQIQWAQNQLQLAEGQRSGQAQAGSRPQIHPFWGTYGPQILPPLPSQADMDPATQADLTRSIQMLQEAQRLSAMASSQIQEVYQNANSKKRKLEDGSNTSEHNASLPPPEPNALHPLFATDPEQRCSVCGASSTPVWRRINKALVCNACGLKKRRSNKKLKDSEQAVAAKTLIQGPGDGSSPQSLAPIAETAA